MDDFNVYTIHTQSSDDCHRHDLNSDLQMIYTVVKF